MDAVKIGRLIYTLRKEKGLTQRLLAEAIGVSDKAVSKWERGMGSPDLSLLPGLASYLSVTLEDLLSGEIDLNESVGGNMKKLKFYICDVCGNIVTATGEAMVTCCGKKLTASEAVKAEEDEKLSVELIENDYFISSQHPMTKDHYITFTAVLTGDSILLRKLYPEWNLQTRIPNFGRGTLLWHCSKDGLFYQYI